MHVPTPNYLTCTNYSGSRSKFRPRVYHLLMKHRSTAFPHCVRSDHERTKGSFRHCASFLWASFARRPSDSKNFSSTHRLRAKASELTHSRFIPFRGGFNIFHEKPPAASSTPFAVHYTTCVHAAAEVSARCPFPCEMTSPLLHRARHSSPTAIEPNERVKCFIAAQPARGVCCERTHIIRNKCGESAWSDSAETRTAARWRRPAKERCGCPTTTTARPRLRRRRRRQRQQPLTAMPPPPAAAPSGDTAP
jgi:hypothetical protein